MTVGVWAALQAWIQQAWFLCCECYVIVSGKVMVCPYNGTGKLLYYRLYLLRNVKVLILYIYIVLYSGSHQKHQVLQRRVWGPWIIMANLRWPSYCWNILLWKGLIDWTEEAIMILTFKRSWNSHKSHIKLIFSHYLLSSVLWEARLEKRKKKFNPLLYKISHMAQNGSFTENWTEQIRIPELLSLAPVLLNKAFIWRSLLFLVRLSVCCKSWFIF